MIDIAEQIIEQQEGEFDPPQFKDHYEEALRELIEKKEKGEDTTVAAPPPDTSNVIDLMDALKKSLKGKGATPNRPRRARQDEEEERAMIFLPADRRRTSTSSPVSSARPRARPRSLSMSFQESPFFKSGPAVKSV